MAEMLHESAARSRRSRAVRLPTSAYTTTCVSRFSIGRPGQAGALDVAQDLHLVLQAPDQRLPFATQRHQLGNGLSALGDGDSLGLHRIQESEALFLELGGGDRLHSHFI